MMALPFNQTGQQFQPNPQYQYPQQQQNQNQFQGGSGGGFWNNIWDFLFGTNAGIGEHPLFDPQQQQALQQILQMGLQQYQNPYEGFEPIKQNALNTFKNDIVPYLQNQFNSTGGHFSSGVLGSSLGGAGASLADKLAAAQSQYGQQNQANARGLIGQGLTQKNQLFNIPEQQGFISKTQEKMENALPMLIKAYSGGGF